MRDSYCGAVRAALPALTLTRMPNSDGVVVSPTLIVGSTSTLPCVRNSDGAVVCLAVNSVVHAAPLACVVGGPLPESAVYYLLPAA